MVKNPYRDLTNDIINILEGGDVIEIIDKENDYDRGEYSFFTWETIDRSVVWTLSNVKNDLDEIECDEDISRFQWRYAQDSWIDSQLINEDVLKSSELWICHTKSKNSVIIEATQLEVELRKNQLIDNYSYLMPFEIPTPYGKLL